MNQKNTLGNEKKVRISSIDAVRAVVLLGIFIVHVKQVFGFQIDKAILDATITDHYLNVFISNFLVNKCAVIFNVLFGVSFYFILKNPTYNASKFIWRCIILFVFGLFNKIFFTADVLCWYAFWGCVLVLFRNFNTRMLLLSVVILKIAGIFIAHLHLGGFIEYHQRCFFDVPFSKIMLFPYAMSNFLYYVLNGPIVDCLSNFILGYYIGKMGWIERLNELVTVKVLIIVFSFYAIVLKLSIFSPVMSLVAGAFYALCIIYAYYHIGFIGKLLVFLESYGKLGLTNYSFQGIFGVVLVYLFGQQILEIGFWLLVFCGIMFYMLQAIFSYVWLKHHIYGPLEYLWRSITNKKFSGNSRTV